jgi:PHD/YefM family antitoxin component YafN of YafNO toxin-antitoxin module
LGQIRKRVRHNNECFVIDRRGEPPAVIMGVEDYLRQFAQSPPVMEKDVADR